MNNLGAYFRLIRWSNLLFIALIIWLMEKMVVVPILDIALFGEQLPNYLLILLMLSTVFIAGGGYAINDYFDVRIDVINRPERLIVTRGISKQQAMLTHQIMTALGAAMGIAVAVICRSFSLGLIYVFVPGLLWFYSSSYKRQFIVGNLIISICAAVTPLLVAVANVAYLNKLYGDILPYTTLTRDIYTWVGGFAMFAFLTTYIREVIKDMQDEEGDREMECHTMPIKIGKVATKVVLVVLMVATIALLYWYAFRALPFEFGWNIPFRYLLFGVVLPFVCELYLLLTAKTPSDYRYAQGLMKFIMLTGTLFSIVIRFSL